MLKKRKGNIDQYIIPLIGVIAMFVVSIASLNYINSANKYISANQIARRYIMKIETKGYLSPDDAAKLKSELLNQGFSNIDISGTTLTKVTNGEDVFLKFKYDQNVRNIKIDKFKIYFADEIKRVPIYRSSTSKN